VILFRGSNYTGEFTVYNEATGEVVGVGEVPPPPAEADLGPPHLYAAILTLCLVAATRLMKPRRKPAADPLLAEAMAELDREFPVKP
jgi:hypothetical protein